MDKGGFVYQANHTVTNISNVVQGAGFDPENERIKTVGSLPQRFMAFFAEKTDNTEEVSGQILKTLYPSS